MAAGVIVHPDTPTQVRDSVGREIDRCIATMPDTVNLMYCLLLSSSEPYEETLPLDATQPYILETDGLFEQQYLQLKYELVQKAVDTAFVTGYSFHACVPDVRRILSGTITDNERPLYIAASDYLDWDQVLFEQILQTQITVHCTDDYV